MRTLHASVLVVAFVCAGLVVTLVAQAQVPKLYEFKNAARYNLPHAFHLESCEQVKHFLIAEVSIADIKNSQLAGCEVCQPLSNEAVRTALGMGSATAGTRRVTESQARHWAIEAAKGTDDPAVFNERFLGLARAVIRDYLVAGSPVVSVMESDALDITLVGQTASFHHSASEFVRKLESVAAAPWPRGVSVSVDPKQIDAPNIEKVVLRRGGETVPPLSSSLALAELKTRMGATVRVSRGVVVYPLSAFESGAEVTIIAIPTSGSNVSMTLTGEELRRLRW